MICSSSPEFYQLLGQISGGSWRMLSISLITWCRGRWFSVEIVIEYVGVAIGASWTVSCDSLIFGGTQSAKSFLNLYVEVCNRM